ncbi:hypothetical protein [Chitinimonas sp. BJYL2]|uniref:hypothetical protein n=1 Tax=Chitinimonas sp. BJYL2 TaxID=2976696 RepID=UPI0022B59952|nr:hypothetical protein [Chitinimonas sp. BJYL2]
MINHFIALLSILILLGVFGMLLRDARYFMGKSRGTAYALFAYAGLTLLGTLVYGNDLYIYRKMLDHDSALMGFLQLLGVMFKNVIPILPGSLALLVYTLVGRPGGKAEKQA